MLVIMIKQYKKEVIAIAKTVEDKIKIYKIFKKNKKDKIFFY